MKKKTQEEFINAASKKHNNKYDYSKSIYNGCKKKVIIICKKHGEFLQEAWSHLKGFGCSACSNNLKSNTPQFISQAIQKHGNEYDYSKSTYKNKNKKLDIICKIHGVFSQTPTNHLSGQGCPACYGTFKKSSVEFIADAIKKHGNIYDYSHINYSTAHSPVNIICKIHGKFSQTPHNHLKGHGCPSCCSSWGETRIEQWLKMNNIQYERQKTFSNLKNPKTSYPLKFDFYVSSKNLLIEYDGEQHFKLGSIFGKHQITIKNLRDIKYRDKIKTKYAKHNKIRLLRIPYTEFPKIHAILNEKIVL